VVTRLRRFSQIVEILSKYGYGIALKELFPGHLRLPNQATGVTSEPATQYERIRLAIEELGPTFVKFGQIMSTRSELLPPEMIGELKKLQDHVKALPFSGVRPVIEEGCPNPDDWFREIDEHPVASASISQVHRAVLRDGTRVALKIQRPGIKEIIETDLLILQETAVRIERVFPEARVYNPTGMVKDFANQIRRELDFLQEARTAERMRQNFRDVPGIHVPTIYWEYSSPRLLVMEYIEGVRIDDLEGITAMGLDPRAIGARGFHAYCRMIFEDGFFHGDPHPGNLLVTREGDIVVLDFGIAGIIRPEKRKHFMDFLAALLEEDTELLIRSLEGLGVAIPAGNREPLQDDLYILMQDLDLGSAISRFNFALFVTELSGVLRQYRIRVPMNLMLLLKVLVMILDIGVQLDPAFNIRDELSPYLVEITKKDALSGAQAKKVSVTLLETIDAVLDMPRYTNLMLRRLSTGTVSLELVATDIQAFQVSLESASDKLMIGLVMGSLVIGSSLVLKAAPLEMPAEISLVAVLGYGAAMLAGFYAVYHIVFLKFREKR
jgi:ubiquinone biosynthesis protein